MLLLSAKHVAEEVDHPVTVAIFVVVPGEARKEASVCECVCVHARARPLTNLPPLSSGIFPLYQATSFTKLSLRAIPALASKMEEWESPLKSVETTCVTISKINGQRPFVLVTGVIKAGGNFVSGIHGGVKCFKVLVT